MAIFSSRSVLILLTFLILSVAAKPTWLDNSNSTSGGKWQLLYENIGVVAMHTQVLRTNQVIMFDRSDFGVSNISLPAGKCRDNDEVVKKDCSAHSVLYDIDSNTLRPIMILTDTWCSSGSLDLNGSLIQTGGFAAGTKVVRIFSPCNDNSCDWFEFPPILNDQRWYATNERLPDNRVIIFGGKDVYTYEFFPKDVLNPRDNMSFPFLRETFGNKREERNLYPFVFLLPDGNLYIFANNRSILFDYKNDNVVKEYPQMPGNVGRNYPLTGSAVMLPLKLNNKYNIIGFGADESIIDVEIMVCGGAAPGNTIKAKHKIYEDASSSCGRLKLTDQNPNWVMEDMPTPRVNNDMMVLPNGDVLIINGGAKGTAGYDCSIDPVYTPILYTPSAGQGNRFLTLNATTIPRMYHSTAVLLPDTRILVAGGNPHGKYNFTTPLFPTEMRLEAFSPPYLDGQFDHFRPLIMDLSDENMAYNRKFRFKISMPELIGDVAKLDIVLVAPPFTTHSFGMNQRVLVLVVTSVVKLSRGFTYKVLVYGPNSENVAPSGYYMMFAINSGIPSKAVWVNVH